MNSTKTGPMTERAAKKDPYDHTGTQRAQAMRQRIKAARGTRLDVPVNGVELAKLDRLVAKGFAASRAEAVRRLINEA